MAIKFFTDKIQIGDYNLFEGNGGIQFDGVARAENFVGGVGTFQGSVSGYMSGGNAGAPPAFNTIDKWPFATDTNASDVGDLATTRQSLTNPGQSSPSYGYATAGSPSATNSDKFPFATDTNATSFTALAFSASGRAGQSSLTHGYASGGYIPTPPYRTNTIDKFPFSTDTTGTDVGDLTYATYFPSGLSSDVNGYTAGGTDPGTAVNNIDKFPFASDANATDVGDITQARRKMSSQSSFTHGYVAGGQVIPAPAFLVNTIEKFPFATNSNATDVGDMLTVGEYRSGQSSFVSGYVSGGHASGPPATNVIQKFPFATNSNATDVGDLTQARGDGCGNQH